MPAYPGCPEKRPLNGCSSIITTTITTDSRVGLSTYEKFDVFVGRRKEDGRLCQRLRLAGAKRSVDDKWRRQVMLLGSHVVDDLHLILIQPRATVHSAQHAPIAPLCTLHNMHRRCIRSDSAADKRAAEHSVSCGVAADATQ